MTTTWILKMNENVWCLGNGSCKFVPSQKMRVSFVVVAISSSFKFRIKGTEEAYNPEEGQSHRKNSGWSSRGWQTRSGWHPPPLSEAGQSSQDQWETTKFPWKVEEVSNVVGELGSLLKDKKRTWQKELQGKPEKRTRSPCFVRSIESSWKGE